MKTIVNTSTVTDYSGETPIRTDSNPVTTTIRQSPPAPVITRYFYNLPCVCRSCCNFCGCRRNPCCNSCCNPCCGFCG